MGKGSRVCVIGKHGFFLFIPHKKAYDGIKEPHRQEKGADKNKPRQKSASPAGKADIAVDFVTP